MNLRPIGQVAQAIITDPLIGSASGYTLVAASPSLSRPDADALERQPLVSDYLHLFEDPGGEARSFFAFHPLPSGSWALTRRFFEGKRRGSFNRVVVHALILPPALLEQIEDPLALRAFGRFEGGRTWVQLGDVLVAQLLGPGVAPKGAVSEVGDLSLALPGDFAELRVQQILSQQKALRRQWGDALLHRNLVTAATIFSGQEKRLLLEPGDELFLAFVLSLLPFRERCHLAWASFVPPEAAESFRLLLTENPREEAARQPDKALTLAFESRLRVPGAEALADLVFREGLLEEWLRQEKGLGASLSEGRGYLAAQIEFLLRGKNRILEGFEDFAELRQFFSRVSVAARAGRAQKSWQDPSWLLSAVVGTLLRQLGRGEPAMLLRVAFDAAEQAGLHELLFEPAVLTAFLANDPGQLGQEGRVAAVGLALLAGRNGEAELEIWRRFVPARLSGEPTTEAFVFMWQAVGADLAVLEEELEGRRILERSSPLEILERVLASGAARAGGELGRALWAQLSPDPGQRLRQGFELLGNRELPEEVLLLLEGEFLEMLLEKTGERLPLLVPGYEEIERLGMYAQLLLARYLGGASGRLEPLPTEFLRGALRADRGDLVGAFLRAAGGDYLRRLGREKGGRDLVKGLRSWWLSGRRLELVPLGREILRLEVVS